MQPLVGAAVYEFTLSFFSFALLSIFIYNTIDYMIFHLSIYGRPEVRSLLKIYMYTLVI